MPEAARSGTVERVLSLRPLPMFESLSPDDLAVVAEHARDRFFRKGRTLLREGQPISAIHIVVQGKVHLARGGRLLGHAERGSAVGGLGVLAREGAGVLAVAETDTLGLEVDVEALLDIFEDHFPILHGVLRHACRNLVELLAQAPGETTGEPTARPGAVPPPQEEMDLVGRLMCLRGAAPFHRSSLNALAELARAMSEVVFEPGDALWTEGAPSAGFFLIVNGHATCRSGSAPAFRVGRGTLAGAAEAVGGLPRSSSAVAETRLVALHATTEALVDAFEDNFEMAMDFLAWIAGATLERIERTAGPDTEAIERFFGCDEAPDDPT